MIPWIQKMFCPPQDLVNNVFQRVAHKQVHTKVIFMPGFGRDTLIYANVEHVSFHLEKDWEIVTNFQEKKYFRNIKSTIEFDRYHEAWCFLKEKLDGFIIEVHLNSFEGGNENEDMIKFHYQLIYHQLRV